MSQQNVLVVQNGYAAFGRGDIPAFLSLLDANVEWKTPGGSDFPMAGTRRGPADVGAFFSILNQVIEFEQFEPQAFIAEGDRVVVLGREKFKVRATGKSLTGDWCHVFTIRNGKVVAFQEYLDTAAIAAELSAATART